VERKALYAGSLNERFAVRTRRNLACKRGRVVLVLYQWKFERPISIQCSSHSALNVSFLMI
jgi:hypothetical protein